LVEDVTATTLHSLIAMLQSQLLHLILH